MPTVDSILTDTPADDGGPILQRRAIREEAELDITPMIDVTFLLLIFFIVASVPDANTAVELPPARYGSAVSKNSSFTITLADQGNKVIDVYLAEGKVGDPLPREEDAQTEAIREAVSSAVQQGKSSVIIKADRGIAYHDVSRVAAAVGLVDGVSLHFAVLETE